MSFYEWIILFKEVDRPIGDLAKDILADPSFPKKETEHDPIEEHLNSKRACWEAIEAFNKAYAYYQLDRV